MKMQPNARQAFSLVEMLTVVSLMVFLSALCLPALQKSTAAQVSTSGAQISGFIESAREDAILTRQPVAVAMLTVTNSAPQRFTALRYIPATSGTSGTWQQISKWEPLPMGILADSTINKAFQPEDSPKLDAAHQLPKLTYCSVNYYPGQNPGYGYVIFLPDGRLFQDSYGTLSIPCILRLTTGRETAGQITYQGPKDTSGGPANYFDIVLNDSTGQAKIVRP